MERKHTQKRYDGIVIKDIDDQDERSKGGEELTVSAFGVGGGSCGGDRVRRDEWSEGAVATLLEAYEAKWVLRNRTKLRGQDWEEVARRVSARPGSARSPKTTTQCKNKIESMKKRYRSESASPDPSTWPLFPRLHDLLLRGRSTDAPPPAPPSPPTPPPPPPPPPPPHPPSSQPLILVDNVPSLPLPSSHPLDARNLEELPGINGASVVAQENGLEKRVLNEEPSGIALGTDSSTPTCSSDKQSPTPATAKNRKKRKRRRRRRAEGRSGRELADSVGCEC